MRFLKNNLGWMGVVGLFFINTELFSNVIKAHQKVIILHDPTFKDLFPVKDLLEDRLVANGNRVFSADSAKARYKEIELAQLIGQPVLPDTIDGTPFNSDRDVAVIIEKTAEKEVLIKFLSKEISKICLLKDIRDCFTQIFGDHHVLPGQIQPGDVVALALNPILDDFFSNQMLEELSGIVSKTNLVTTVQGKKKLIEDLAKAQLSGSDFEDLKTIIADKILLLSPYQDLALDGNFHALESARRVQVIKTRTGEILGTYTYFQDDKKLLPVIAPNLPLLDEKLTDYSETKIAPNIIVYGKLEEWVSDEDTLVFDQWSNEHIRIEISKSAKSIVVKRCILFCRVVVDYAAMPWYKRIFGINQDAKASQTFDEFFEKVRRTSYRYFDPPSITEATTFFRQNMRKIIEEERDKLIKELNGKPLDMEMLIERVKARSDAYTKADLDRFMAWGKTIGHHWQPHYVYISDSMFCFGKSKVPYGCFPRN